MISPPPIPHRNANGQLKGKSRARRLGDFSFVYVAEVDGTDLIKVGFSANPSVRVSALSTEIRRPVLLRWMGKVENGASKIEARFHKRFKPETFNAIGEWYRLTADSAISALMAIGRELGIAVDSRLLEREPNAATRERWMAERLASPFLPDVLRSASDLRHQVYVGERLAGARAHRSGRW